MKFSKVDLFKFKTIRPQLCYPPIGFDARNPTDEEVIRAIKSVPTHYADLVIPSTGTQVLPGTGCVYSGSKIVGGALAVLAGMMVYQDTTDKTYHPAGAIAATGTTIAAGSNGVVLPTIPSGIINVVSTTGFPTSGTFIINVSGVYNTVTYTGLTSTTFTGCVCTAGTSTIVTTDPVTTYANVNGALTYQAAGIALSGGSPGQPIHVASGGQVILTSTTISGLNLTTEYYLSATLTSNVADGGICPVADIAKLGYPQFRIGYCDTVQSIVLAMQFLGFHP